MKINKLILGLLSLVAVSASATVIPEVGYTFNAKTEEYIGVTYKWNEDVAIGYGNYGTLAKSAYENTKAYSVFIDLPEYNKFRATVGVVSSKTALKYPASVDTTNKLKFRKEHSLLLGVTYYGNNINLRASGFNAEDETYITTAIGIPF